MERGRGGFRGRGGPPRGGPGGPRGRGSFRGGPGGPSGDMRGRGSGFRGRGRGFGPRPEGGPPPVGDVSEAGPPNGGFRGRGGGMGRGGFMRDADGGGRGGFRGGPRGGSDRGGRGGFVPRGRGGPRGAPRGRGGMGSGMGGGMGGGLPVKRPMGGLPPTGYSLSIGTTYVEISSKADVSGDKLLGLDELADYIHMRTKSHIEDSLQENYGLFMLIDNNPRNGVVSWLEYHDYFLMKHGVDEEYIRSHNEKHPGLGRSLKESIARDKASWSETAKNDPEYLTLDEFLAFRHPESSAHNILTLVDDLLDKLDRDGDEMLTEEEFALLQVSGSVGETLVSQGEEQRRIEFRSAIDKDNNLLADRKELLRYIDPRNPRHAREEASTLVALADADKDGKLSLEEVLSKMDLFLASKMINTAKSFHDEF